MGEHQSDIKIIDEYGQESGHIPARHRAIYLLPNAFTTAALFAGFFAIVKAMSHEFDIAAVAIPDGRMVLLAPLASYLYHFQAPPLSFL